MILTLTLNPSLDHTLVVESFTPGGRSEVERSSFEAGGKGVNVAQVLTMHEVPVRALMALGGPQGRQLAEMLTAAEVSVEVVEIAGDTRSNVTIEEPDGRLSRLSVAGPRVTHKESDQIEERLAELAIEADWVVLAGSLPHGMGHTTYARLVESLRSVETKIAVDTSGPSLRAVLDVGADLLKPNVHELAEAVGAPIHTVAEALAAAESLRARGTGAVLASLGADGALLVDATGQWLAQSPPVHVASSIGAGDSMVAGFLAHGGQGPDALAAAVVFGAAAVRLAGTQLPGPHDLVGLSAHPEPAAGVERALTTIGNPDR